MLQLADSMGAAESAAGLYVRFTKVPKQDMEASEAAGHPVFHEVDYITIVVPGDKSSEVCRPVTPDDKARFHKAWERYVSGQGEALDGFPLKDWPGATRAQVEELAYFRVYTVEQLANVSDGNLRNMGPALALRQRARDYLERARSEAPVQRMRQELEARDAMIANLQARVEALAQRQESAPEASTKRKRGRPPGEAEANPDARALDDSGAEG